MTNPYDDFDFPDSDPMDTGDGIYYDGGVYGPYGGPDIHPRDDETRS